MGLGYRYVSNMPIGQICITTGVFKKEKDGQIPKFITSNLGFKLDI